MDIADFHNGRYCANKLANLVGLLQRQRTSYLSWAINQDTELYRAQRRQQNRPARRASAPESFEFGLAEEMGSALIALVQHLIHVTATHGTPAAGKKPRITHWPRPETAAQLVAREDTRAAYQHIESLIVYSDEPYTKD